MPIEIDAIWRLVNPAFAIPVALVVIALPAFVANRTLRNRSGIDRDVYARKMAMAAELLVSIGIIGLITFTARVKIESDIRQAGVVAAEQRNHVSLEVGEFARVYCMNRDKSVVTRDTGAINYVCHFWSQVLNGPEAEIDWGSARYFFVEFAGFSRLSPNLVTSLRGYAAAIDQLIEAKRNLKISQDKKGLVESEISWWLVAICTLFAAMGVALKWARAAAELKEVRTKLLSQARTKAQIAGQTYTYTYQYNRGGPTVRWSEQGGSKGVWSSSGPSGVSEQPSSQQSVLATGEGFVPGMSFGKL